MKPEYQNNVKCNEVHCGQAEGSCLFCCCHLPCWDCLFLAFFFFFSLLSSLWVLSACFCSLPLCASLEVHSARVSVMQQCFLVHVNHCQVFSFLCIFYCTCCFNKAVSHEKPSVRGFTTGMRCSVDFLFAAKISKQHSSLQCTFLWLSVLFKYINAISKTNFKGLSECFQLFLVCILDQKLLTNFEFWNGRMTVFSRETYANKHRGKKKIVFLVADANILQSRWPTYILIFILNIYFNSYLMN